MNEHDMSHQRLREKLTELHAELARTETMDADTRQLLTDLSEHIQVLLDQSASTLAETPAELAAQQYRPLRERLRSDMARFEASHPRLTAAMERAIDALVQMGV